MLYVYEELENGKFKCPFCGEIHQHQGIGTPIVFDCIAEFSLDIVACMREILSREYNNDEKISAWNKLGHYICQNYLYYKRKANTGFTAIDYKWVLDSQILPTPVEQMDYLLMYLAEHTKYLGKTYGIIWKTKEYLQLQNWIGARNKKNTLVLLNDLVRKNMLVSYQQLLTWWNSELTVEGWEYVARLNKISKNRKQVFMAMKFEPEQRKFMKQVLYPAIKELGLELKLLPEIQSKENLIDNKLRVAIKQSRFLICDLTHGNQGAYWEAGYAEGLGLPVIYICEKSIMKGKNRPHFDVNHQEIYFWKKEDEKNISSFLEDLKAEIMLITQ